MSTWPQRAGKLAETGVAELLGLLLGSLIFIPVLLPAILIGGGHWWEAFVISPLLLLTLLAVVSFRDSLHATAERRAEARLGGESLRHVNVVGRAWGWAADHERLTYFLLASLLLLFGAITQGAGWAALLVVVGAPLSVFLLLIMRFLRSRLHLLRSGRE